MFVVSYAFRFQIQKLSENIMKPFIFFINQKTNNITEKSEELRAVVTKRKKRKTKKQAKKSKA